MERLVRLSSKSEGGSDALHVLNGDGREGLNPFYACLFARHGKSNPGIELRQINPTGKSLLIIRNRVKPRNQKYFASLPAQISSLIRTVPFQQEGRSRVVTSARRDEVDAAAPCARKGTR